MNQTPSITEGQRAASLVGRTVQLVKGPWTHAQQQTDLVVLSEQPTTYRPEPWVGVPSTMYELHWPDGGTTWHYRHEFQPIEVGTRD